MNTPVVHQFPLRIKWRPVLAVCELETSGALSALLPANAPTRDVVSSSEILAASIELLPACPATTPPATVSAGTKFSHGENGDVGEDLTDHVDRFTSAHI